ncbi:MAG: hypothetical protein HYX48_05505 [Chlamydiales bacterium]|nr:hypothetical protein [Chlamydiales bacterium]
MAISLESNSCSFCTVSDLGVRNGMETPFGKVCLGWADITSDTSGIFRNAVSTLSAIHEQNDPIATSTLGITTTFSIVGGVLGFHKGWHESILMQRISDATGSVLATLKYVRGAVQTVAGLFFVPARAFSIMAYAKASKSMESIAGSCGTIGGSLFGVTSLLLGASSVIDLTEEISLRRELNASYIGKNEAVKSASVVALLREKLEVTLCEQIDADNDADAIEALRQKKISVLSRAIGSDSVTAVQSASTEHIQAVAARVFSENASRILLSSVSLALCAMGVAAAIIPLVTAAPSALVAAALLNTLGALGWLAIDINQLIECSANSLPGRYDHLLMLMLTAVCLAAVISTALLEVSFALQLSTAGIALLWTLMLGYCLTQRYT